MRILSTACLIVCASCVIGITVRDPQQQQQQQQQQQRRRHQVPSEEVDDLEFDLEQFGVEDDEEAAEQLVVEEEEEEEDVERLEAPRNRVLEPEAEMLPASYKGIKPPGVDHMEMTREPSRKKKKAESRNRLVYRFAREDE